MPESKLLLGTRRSPLALAQSRLAAAALEQQHAGLEVELVPMITRGDVERGDLKPLGGKGLFTEELERGLTDGSLDLAVHSLKDLPVSLPDGLTIAAYPERADPRDVLVCDVAESLEELAEGSVLLTGSHRRQAQILHAHPQLVVEPIRGNVGTRLRKWIKSGHAGLILAAAGLERLGVDDIPAYPLSPEQMLPAPGQGILALEVRTGSRAEELCAALNHPPTARAAQLERHIVEAFGGDCTLPLAAWARELDRDREDDGTEDHGKDTGGMELTAVLATPDGCHLCRAGASGDDPAKVAEACVEAMVQQGANQILARLRS
ncbi:MAG: hydroxymethylbilane synthase [Acidobacteriota bacterium]